MATLRPAVQILHTAILNLAFTLALIVLASQGQAQSDDTQYVVETNCNGQYYQSNRVRIEEAGAVSRVILVDGTPCISAGAVLMEVRRSAGDTMQGLMYYYEPGSRMGFGFGTDVAGFDWARISTDNLRFNDGRSRRLYQLKVERDSWACRVRFSSEFAESGVGFRCLCPELAEVQKSWMPGVKGTNIYSSDSNICQAAVHAGIIGTEGGEVRILRPIDPNALVARCPYFYGNNQNGIESRGKGQDTAYFFQGSLGICDEDSPPESEDVWYCRERFADYDQEYEADGPFSCHCSEAATSFGTVFGTEHYTGDSSICLAAFHWGAVGAEGGTVQLVPEPGRSAYRGSTRNEVTSYNWRTYPFGFRFE